jgi:nucleoside-diphosphate-sugar epimerase
MKKKYVVTGGCGFIGSHIVDKLVKQGHEVVVIDNLSGAASDKHYKNEGATYHHYDICDHNNTVGLYSGAECVFHLAAEARIQPTLKNPILATQTNALGTCVVLQCCKEVGVKRVVYSSTSAAYGLKNEPPLQESFPKDCLNPYSVTKTFGEEMCRVYSDLFDLETVCFRYFNVYGERQPLKGRYAPVVGIFLRQRDEEEPMTIIGDGEQRRDFTYVKDIVEANLLASNLENKDCVGELFNVGCGKNYSILEIKDMIGGDFVFSPERKGEVRISLADISKIKEKLGWEPQTSLPQWISEVNESRPNS